MSGRPARALEAALDARRQRIILSQSTVNWVKWTALVGLALLTSLAIATQDRPFNGQFGVKPDVLLQVMPPPG